MYLLLYFPETRVGSTLFAYEIQKLHRTVHLLRVTAFCLICPNMWGTEIKLSSISREFYQKETINVPVNKQTYLLYSHGCHSPEIVNSRESVGNLDNLSVKMAKAAKSHSVSIISAYLKHTNLLNINLEIPVSSVSWSLKLLKYQRKTPLIHLALQCKVYMRMSVFLWNPNIWLNSINLVSNWWSCDWRTANILSNLFQSFSTSSSEKLNAEIAVIMGRSQPTNQIGWLPFGGKCDRAGANKLSYKYILKFICDFIISAIYKSVWLGPKSYPSNISFDNYATISLESSTDIVI